MFWVANKDNYFSLCIRIVSGDMLYALAQCNIVFKLKKFSLGVTRNIFKKDIRRLSNTDDKRNQIRWF